MVRVPRMSRVWWLNCATRERRARSMAGNSVRFMALLPSDIIYIYQNIMRVKAKNPMRICLLTRISLQGTAVTSVMAGGKTPMRNRCVCAVAPDGSHTWDEESRGRTLPGPSSRGPAAEKRAPSGTPGASDDWHEDCWVLH